MVRIYISIGSNEQREANITASLDELQAHFGNVQRSSVYESVAVGFEGAAFYNLVAVCDTDLSAADVIRQLKQIEDIHGRDRSRPKFSDRSMDLDLLLYDDLVDEKLGLPRDEILRHAHVLAPLAELIPDVSHPQSGKTYQTLWNEFSDDSQKLWIVEFPPQLTDPA